MKKTILIMVLFIAVTASGVYAVGANTRNKRASAVSMAILPIFPNPDGTIDANDRGQMMGIYPLGAVAEGEESVTDWYVSSESDRDSQDIPGYGMAPGTPFATLQYCLTNYADSGDTIWMEGAFDYGGAGDKITLSPEDMNDWITIKSLNENRVRMFSIELEGGGYANYIKFDGSANGGINFGGMGYTTTNNATIELSNCKYIIITGCNKDTAGVTEATIHGPESVATVPYSDDYSAIKVIGTSSEITISDNVIEDSSIGIDITPTTVTNVTISNNTIKHIGEFSIYGGYSGIVINDNTISDMSTAYTDDIKCWGIYRIYGSSTTPGSYEISRNTIIGNSTTAATVIYMNLVGSTNSGFVMKSNLIYNTFDKTLVFLAGLDDGTILNNTIINNAPGNETDGAIDFHTSTIDYMYRNIFSSMKFEDSGEIISNHGYNVYEQEIDTGARFSPDATDVSSADLSTGYFINYSSHDYTIGGASSALGIAAATANEADTVDITNQSRSDGLPDMGAYEYFESVDVAVWYLNNLADSGGDGTTSALTGANAAFSSLAALLAEVNFNAGDVVYIYTGSGTYGSLSINYTGAASGYRIWGAASGHLPVFDRMVFTGNFSAQDVFIGITINSVTETVQYNGDNNLYDYGISITDTDDLVFVNCTINGGYFDPVTLQSVTFPYGDNYFDTTSSAVKIDGGVAVCSGIILNACTLQNAGIGVECDTSEVTGFIMANCTFASIGIACISNLPISCDLTSNNFTDVEKRRMEFQMTGRWSVDGPAEGDELYQSSTGAWGKVVIQTSPGPGLVDLRVIQTNGNSFETGSDLQMYWRTNGAQKSGLVTDIVVTAYPSAYAVISDNTTGDIDINIKKNKFYSLDNVDSDLYMNYAAAVTFTNLTLENNLFYGNTNVDGSVILDGIDASACNIINNTIIDTLVINSPATINKMYNNVGLVLSVESGVTFTGSGYNHFTTGDVDYTPQTGDVMDQTISTGYFTDYASDDYSLLGYSDAVDAGDTTAGNYATDDILNNTRGSSPDIGAYEDIKTDPTAPAEATNAGITVAEGGTETVNTAELEYTDAVSATTDIVYTITSNPSNGTFKISGGTVTTWTQAQIDASSLSYVHDDSDTTSDSIGFSVRDAANNTNTGNTFAITVTAVDDATPTETTNNTLPVVRGSSGNIVSSSYLVYTDPAPDSQPAGSVQYVLVTAPSYGDLKLSGVTLSATNTWTQTDIDSGNVTYDNNGNASETDTFIFTVNDGQSNSTGSVTFNISVGDDTVTTSPSGFNRKRRRMLDNVWRH